ncbi:signal peptidase I [Candidatus Dojkabacteria bacterium HGW-Dojkabacteria-1]|uniref:Signal peptidase I n=1 Tax=Candidatus Dojkabacteria bacterium HGW-Dojkabacteria-1 TaxID=2013761 RepID=A0A2N2F3V6_9BACT|nr:MAG: signal peptidase I [Candidatus Dojkabacteria bacterium HGW-Dojkabacteria-1]
MIKGILKIIEWGIFLLLLFVLFLVASPLLPTNEYVSTHIVSTGSMEPKIKAGSIVFSTLKNDEINRGDIIVFTSPDNQEITVIHRVRNITEEGYITKGDNNKSEDNWVVNTSNIKGKVIFDLPYLGYAVEWMKTPIGFISLLILPALIFLISQIRRIREGINEEVEKRTKEEVERIKLRDTNPPLIIFIVLVNSLLFSINTTNTYALFSSTAEITGMVIATGEIEENPRSVVLNEIMWMGSTISEKDEWIELRNMTDKEIDISGWRIEGAVAGSKGHLQIPNGYMIPANGYFLIANKYEEDRSTALNVSVDLRSTSINLNDDYLKNGILVLKDKNGNEIDKTGIGNIWPSGLNEETKHSMQRHTSPEDGWYTCMDPICGSDIYWIVVGQNFGTPGGPNL